MIFVAPITIKAVVENIHQKKYLLPAIQREFVWGTDQIELLFDSLMQDYPINSFLFWEVDKKNIQKYQFYEFLREYHERDNTHNIKANVNGQNSIIAILDGQQRLTSLYIGLKGSYAYKLPRLHWHNDLAFPKRKLYLNLLKESGEFDRLYDFKFLTDKEASANDASHYWFLVGKILNLTGLSDIMSLVRKTAEGYSGEHAEFAGKALTQLFQVVHLNTPINFFLENGESLDKVLNIFIRINSGGTPLSYSDLLLSIASAQWAKKDAREEIVRLVDEINKIGDGFDVDKDFILKTCLVLSDIKDIAFKVDNFNHTNMNTIEKKWDDISQSIRLAFLLLSSFGYKRETLTSNYVVIPIAYYLYKLDNPESFDIASEYEKDRHAIAKWLALALLKRIFSGQPDNILRPIRDILKNEKSFPLDTIIDKFKGTNKSLAFDDAEIENLFNYQYGQAYTYSVLALLYPSLDFRNKFHEDHIFPKTLFTERKLKGIGLSGEEIDFYLDYYNTLPNLQLLEGVLNQEKSRTPFDQWIEKRYPKRNGRQSYMERNYIPPVSLKMDNFKEFVEKRTELITKRLKKILK
jgi:uncharacterized protein with ParB-like and HNH nuclease domain